MNRTLKVVRMQLVNRQTFIWIPLIVLAGAFVLSLVVFSLIPVDGIKVGGAQYTPLWYFLAAGAMSMAYTFPYSQAMSITRREYFLGTLLSAMITATMLAAISLVGSAIEWATSGWGMNGWFFITPGGTDLNLGGQVAFTFGAAMLFFVIGFWSATVFKRFGPLWLTVIWAGIAAALILIAWVVTQVDGWGAVGTWIVAQSLVTWGLWLLLLAAALGGISYLTLRRAVP